MENVDLLSKISPMMMEKCPFFIVESQWCNIIIYSKLSVPTQLRLQWTNLPSSLANNWYSILMQGLQIPPLIIMWDTSVSCNTPLHHKHNIFSLVYIFSILISSWVCKECKEFGFSSQYWAHKSIRHQRLETVRISWMQGGSSPWPLYKQISYQWHQ